MASILVSAAHNLRSAFHGAQHRKHGPLDHKARSRRWRQDCAPLVVKAPTDLRKQMVERCSGKSNRRVASASSCDAAWPRSRAMAIDLHRSHLLKLATTPPPAATTDGRLDIKYRKCGNLPVSHPATPASPPVLGKRNKISYPRLPP